MELSRIIVLTNMQINQTHICNINYCTNYDANKLSMVPFICKSFLCTKSSTKK